MLLFQFRGRVTTDVIDSGMNRILLVVTLFSVAVAYQLPGSALVRRCNSVEQAPEDCHYQGGEYGPIFYTSTTRICLVTTGCVPATTPHCNSGDCWHAAAYELLLVDPSLLPSLIGFKSIGEYPPLDSTESRYDSLYTTPLKDRSIYATLLRCKFLSIDGKRGHCYTHGNCQGVIGCLNQLSDLIFNFSGVSDTGVGSLFTGLWLAA